MADTLTIDTAGRVVIPAPIRRALALAAGTEMTYAVENGAIVLRPIARAQLDMRVGRLIVTSPLVGAVPDHRELREERLDDATPGPDVG